MNLSFDPLHRAAMPKKVPKPMAWEPFFLPLSNFADQRNDPADRGRDKKVQRCGRTALGVDRPPRLPIGGALHALDTPDLAVADPTAGR